MNENLDLRNRILKMRESNKLVLDEFKSNSKIIDTYSNIIPEETKNDLNSRGINLETKLEKESSIVEGKKIEKSSLFKKESACSDNKNSNKQTSNSLVNDNEAQFRMIAKKFNEAVEVILELSDKVKKLEQTVHGMSDKSSKNSKKYFFLNLKIYISIIITFFLILGLFTFPIDLTLIKLIIADVVSSI